MATFAEPRLARAIGKNALSSTKGAKGRRFRVRICAIRTAFFLQILRIQDLVGPILQGDRGQKAGIFGHVFCGE